MALQSGSLAMAALGVRGDTPPVPIQPPLADGVHLRWWFARELGFPWYGFHLFRRAHLPGTPAPVTGGLKDLQPGTVPSPLELAGGTVTSDRPLVLTDVFPPGGDVELDLEDRGYLRFTLKPGDLARRMDVRVGFREKEGAPPPPVERVDFRGRQPGSGPNPRIEGEVRFLARHRDGRPLPVTHVQRMQTSAGPLTGLDTEWEMEITLPAACMRITALLTPGNKGVTVEAFNEDGTSAGRTTLSGAQGSKARTPQTVAFTGTALVRLVVSGPAEKSLLHELTFQRTPTVEVVVTALAGETVLARIPLSGRVGEVLTLPVEFDGLTAVELSPATAALVGLSRVSVTDGATEGWEPLEGGAGGDGQFLRLPVQHPDYPCTPGAAEDLEAARALAASRILYGDPAEIVAAPSPVPGVGTVSVTAGSPVVTGAGTAWTADLVGAVLRVGGDATAYGISAVLAPDRLVLTRPYGGATAADRPYSTAEDSFADLHDHLAQLVAGGPGGPPMAERTSPLPATVVGTVSTTTGSPVVTGAGTGWSAGLAGLWLQLDGEAAAHRIASVDSATQLTLERPYGGPTAAGRAYRITVRLEGGGDDAPAMGRQFPLDLVLLAALHPAFAQLLGLYWVDRTAEPGVAYDYLLVADRSGEGELTPARVLEIVAGAGGFDAFDAWITHNAAAAPRAPLASPVGARAFALPAGTPGSPSAVGVRWELGAPDAAQPPPGAAVMYHLWRAELGEPEPTAPPAQAQLQLRTVDGPLMPRASAPSTAQRPADWPPFPLHALDGVQGDGWYAYAVSGIDVWGRHSAPGAPAEWWQWAPAPEPRPWYYQEPAEDRAVHPFAVHLPDFTPPPAPTAVEAYALDPQDPTVLRDAAFDAWWGALQAAPWYQALSEAEKRNLIGLRVRWKWTHAQIEQAPDTREFRVYWQPGLLNAAVGRTLSVTALGGGLSRVETDVANDHAEGAWAGASLRVGQDSFTVLASEAGTPLVLTVRNVGVADEIGPRAGAACTLAIPPAYQEGRVSLTQGSPVVSGQGTRWTAALEGQPFQPAGDLDAYRVAGVQGAGTLTLDRPYTGATEAGRGYAILHPLAVDYAAPWSWEERLHVVGYAESVTVGADEQGRPVRTYEAFLPDPAGDVHAGLPLAPDVLSPVVYAHLGVSAADDVDYVPDDPERAGTRWGGRPGNEGRVAQPARVFRVLREPPPPPEAPQVPLPPVVYATPADYHGRSYYTFRWSPAPGLRTHVFRAMDDALFAADLAQPARVLDPSRPADRIFFPNGPRWDDQLRQSAAAELNAVQALKGGPREAALAAYRALSVDALQVLAALPGTGGAFTQLTVLPLDPADPETADRRGPDDPAAYAPSPAVRAWTDALDGRATNRYFYRAAYVDAANNRGPLGPPTPPVHLPRVTPPPAPSWNGVQAGTDATATLRWEVGRAPELAEHRLYRAESEAAAGDVRRMQLVHTAEIESGVDARPAALEWTDADLVGGARYHYRLTAVDAFGNVSAPSDVLSVTAVDTRIPEPPVWRVGRWVLLVDADGSEEAWPEDGIIPAGRTPAVRLEWESPVRGASFRVSRRARGDLGWRPLALEQAATEPGRYLAHDTTADPAEVWSYRATVTSAAGVVSQDWRALDVPRPPQGPEAP